MQPLDYRGLGRWSHILLSFALLVISTWVMVAAGMLMSTFFVLILSLVNPFLAMEAATKSAVIAMWAAVIAPIFGIAIGALAALTAKRSVIDTLSPKLVPEHSPLWNVTAELAGKMGMPVPEVFIYEDKGMNAWATGCRPESSAVIVTRGLLDKFDGDELAAIIAHELGHIASGDTWRMQFASSYQKSMVWSLDFAGARWLVRGTIAVIGELAVLSLSRRREYWADAVGAALTSPEAVVRALKRIHGETDGKVPWKLRRTAMRWADGGVLLSSHPTCDQRVNAVLEGAFVSSVLRKMGRRDPASDFVPAWRTLKGSLPVQPKPDEKPPELPQWASYRDALRKLGEVSVKEGYEPG